MIKKTCALIFDNERLLIIKDINKYEWRFPAFEWEKNKRPNIKAHLRTLKTFKYQIKDEGYSLWVMEKNLILEGRIFNLIVDLSKFKVSKNIDLKWMPLNELDDINFEEYSAKIVKEIIKDNEKHYFQISVAKTNIKRNLISNELDFCQFCTLLKAKVEFNKSLMKEKTTFKYDMKNVVLKCIKLTDLNTDKLVRRDYLDRKDLDYIMKTFHREWWIDDNIDISHIKLNPYLEDVINQYKEMLENEDKNIIVLWEDLGMFFNNAYEDGELSLKDLEKLKYKYKVKNY